MDIGFILHVTANSNWEAHQRTHKKAVENHSFIHYQFLSLYNYCFCLHQQHQIQFIDLCENVGNLAINRFLIIMNAFALSTPLLIY